ncbi:hypothetical protein Tmar_1429 [Thermaerobacter marianensis DSM 12885]|uniref:DUF4395 domain-containing protein n=1 Tax=Thermaerobacter marianensis (strain ATCC 700841 / DSM 12885 / JCM 10246 / 7p75a) TaxID=644966 RepID=E6SMQ0_THEM7|nr:DUF4395 domain-containing protein [Thermaerobacter marianensis]ADU51542.1 hypothetical protein Tmar_1429 [Thermaerobacter marianensis DSM 12885]
MRDGIPVPLVRANQAFIILAAVASFVFQFRAGALIGLAVLVLPLLFGPRAHLVFHLARPLVARRLPGAEREDAHVQRFNQTLAALFFAIGAAGLYLLEPVAPLWGAVVGWGALLAVATVAFIATRGFCLGCTVYYQLVRRGWIRRPGPTTAA